MSRSAPLGKSSQTNTFNHMVAEAGGTVKLWESRPSRIYALSTQQALGVRKVNKYYVRIVECCKALVETSQFRLEID